MEKTNKTTTIVLVLTLTFAAIFIALPVSGQRTGNIKSYPFIGATPNPVGKDQEVLLHMGITEPLENVGQGWVGLSVTIEKPDGHTDTISDIKTTRPAEQADHTRPPWSAHTICRHTSLGNGKTSAVMPYILKPVSAQFWS